MNPTNLMIKLKYLVNYSFTELGFIYNYAKINSD